MTCKSSILAAKFEHDRESRTSPSFDSVLDCLRFSSSESRNAIPKNWSIGALAIQDESDVEMVRAHAVLILNSDCQRAGANYRVAVYLPRLADSRSASAALARTKIGRASCRERV